MSEDIFQLYLEASTEWQKAFQVVPGGLGLPYTKVRMTMFNNLVKQDLIKIKSKTILPAEIEPQQSDNFTTNVLRDLRQSTAKSESLILARQDETLSQLKILTAQMADMQKQLIELKQSGKSLL
jgi:hypothetical protein